MTEDLRPFGVTVNMLLPGGATATGMVPDGARRSLLPPEVMGPPVVFLASAEADGLTGERIVAKDFDRFLAELRSRPAPPD
jgi:gluconate 5-dehydrogenase